jgi:hypothetical protein
VTKPASFAINFPLVDFSPVPFPPEEYLAKEI